MPYSFLTDVDDGIRSVALYHQPIRSFYNESLNYSEVLLRVQDYESETHSPGRLLNKIKSHGWMNLLDRCVIQAVFDHLSNSDDHRTYGINLSGESINNNGVFLKYLIREISIHEVDPNRIVFEINEQALISWRPEIVDAVRRLKEMGVRIALDDFGTESLNLLDVTYVQPDYLKISGKFADLDDDFNRAVVESLARIASIKGITSVVEGVETLEQFQACEKLGADAIQGFYLGQPQFLTNLNTGDPPCPYRSDCLIGKAQPKSLNSANSIRRLLPKSKPHFKGWAIKWGKLMGSSDL